MMERFLLDQYSNQQQSTYALNIFTYKGKHPEIGDVSIKFWDTAGQDSFDDVHPSFYFKAQAAIMVFDVTRKITYTNLTKWWDELQRHSPGIPVMCVANKIDADPSATSKSFKFPQTHNLPMYFCSASDGTNVVQIFRDAIKLGYEQKQNPADQFMADVFDIVNQTQSS
ncbi:putative RTW, Ras superfamily GTPase [Blattamonas nauphoetae]|uniref:RTW, Ras superfamily GTPase n=1 Tax=Blattamonas nauphoetae TaxID=2049346 RepID=A0ABQ9XCW0_9EUKA|nr:putative RTW, Ras superfamily GTPase [Blattamonas nauphoetae]